MADTIIKSLWDYFMACPLMEDNKINVDFLPEKGMEYSINTSPTDEIVKRYTSGDTIRQRNFTLSSVNDYADNILQNIENSSLYENFAEWLEKQNTIGNLPDLPTGKQSIKIESLTPGYLFSATAKSGRYQIQCKLQYYQEA